MRPPPGLKLMDQVRPVFRHPHYADRTKQTSCQWIRRDSRHFGGKPPPHRLGAKEAARFLSHLPTAGQVSASTQRQARTTLVLRSRQAMDQPLAAAIAPVLGT